METAQRRPVPFGRLITVTLAAATLIAAIGLLAANDTIELPVIEGGEATTSRAEINAPAVNRPTDRLIGGSIFPNASDSGVDQRVTLAGHRYQVYLEGGFEFAAEPARPAGTQSIPAERSSHRYFLTEAEPNREDSGKHRENSRIGLASD
jgi:hypothetical protein